MLKKTKMKVMSSSTCRLGVPPIQCYISGSASLLSHLNLVIYDLIIGNLFAYEICTAAYTLYFYISKK